MPRRFLALFFAVFFALTALFAGTVYVLDPYYHFHGPVLGMPLWLRYPRYQSPGAAKNLPYDHLLLGTSVTANFHTDQFDEALGGRTQKIINVSGRLIFARMIKEITVLIPAMKNSSGQ